jgi:hypothetical protein
LQKGGILIDQPTFKYLGAVQHHFSFGREGYVKLPTENKKNMIIELLLDN